MDLADSDRSVQWIFSQYGRYECHEGGRREPNHLCVHFCRILGFHYLLRVQEDTRYQGQPNEWNGI